MSEGEEHDFTIADARRFIAGIDSDYFHDVCVALRGELEVTNPAQAAALDALCDRLAKVRDLLEKRLTDLRRPEHAAPKS